MSGPEGIGPNLHLTPSEAQAAGIIEGAFGYVAKLEAQIFFGEILGLPPKTAEQLHAGFSHDLNRVGEWERLRDVADALRTINRVLGSVSVPGAVSRPVAPTSATTPQPQPERIVPTSTPATVVRAVRTAPPEEASPTTAVIADSTDGQEPGAVLSSAPAEATGSLLEGGVATDLVLAGHTEPENPSGIDTPPVNEGEGEKPIEEEKWEIPVKSIGLLSKLFGNEYTEQIARLSKVQVQLLVEGLADSFVGLHSAHLSRQEKELRAAQFKDYVMGRDPDEMREIYDKPHHIIKANVESVRSELCSKMPEDDLYAAIEIVIEMGEDEESEPPAEKETA